VISSSLFKRLEFLLLRFADLVSEHGAKDVIINFEMYRYALQFYTEVVNEQLEVLMIPRLINNLEESTGNKVIWTNDAVNIAQYKNIEKALFLGLHPINRAPYLLNYAVNEENMELNFEITTVWGFLRDWVYQETVNLDASSLNDKITGNFVLQFNKKSELIYINEFEKQELDPFFEFPQKVMKQEELGLQKILRHKVLFETISGIVIGLVESGERESEISKPHINIRISLDDRGRMRGFTLVFMSSALQASRLHDPFADFEFAVTPMSVIKNEDGGGEDSLADNNLSVYSNRESIFSGIRRRTAHPKLGIKKSGFGTRKDLSRPEGLLEPPLQNQNEGPGTDFRGKNVRNYFMKQGSRFTNEGSLFSEGLGEADLKGIRGGPLNAFRSGGNALQSPDGEDSQQKYKMIEERVNKSIVMEYMQGERVGHDQPG
jgi:hypothetical protein